MKLLIAILLLSVVIAEESNEEVEAIDGYEDLDDIFTEDEYNDLMDDSDDYNFNEYGSGFDYDDYYGSDLEGSDLFTGDEEIKDEDINKFMKLMEELSKVKEDPNLSEEERDAQFYKKVEEIKDTFDLKMPEEKKETNEVKKEEEIKKEL